MHGPKYTGKGGGGLIAFAQDMSIPYASCSASNTNRDVWEVGGRFDWCNMALTSRFVLEHLSYILVHVRGTADSTGNSRRASNMD